MLDAKLKSAYVLSTIVAVLALIAAPGGLALDNLYRRDNRLVNCTQFRVDFLESNIFWIIARKYGIEASVRSLGKLRPKFFIFI